MTMRIFTVVWRVFLAIVMALIYINGQVDMLTNTHTGQFVLCVFAALCAGQSIRRLFPRFFGRANVGHTKGEN